ncbi:MAG: hypothetical protein HRU21_10655 [Pseudomonadales bacterium]|nr:hypothetical protein [Pseudomonadales bacterium]
MPSKWETSGIDWDNITKHRTSHVIYELAQATAETYNRALGSTILSRQNNYPIAPDYTQINFNIRQEEILLFIIDKLKRMFAVDESYFFNGSLPNGTKCFVSNNVNPSIQASYYDSTSLYAYYNEYLMGIPTLDYSEGGELEQNCGDLSFLRDDFYFGRITSDILDSIYKMLTYPMKCIQTPWSKDLNGDYAGKYLNANLSKFSRYIRSRFGSHWDLDQGRGEDYINNAGYTPDINLAVARMYQNLDPPTARSLQDVPIANTLRLDNNQDFSGAWVARADNRRYYARISLGTETNINNGSLDVNDMKMDIIKWSFKDNDKRYTNPDFFGLWGDFGIYPLSSPYTTETTRVNNINYSVIPTGTNFDPVGFWDIGDEVITSGLPTLPVQRTQPRYEKIIQTYLGLGKINAKGLMDYYTEDD